MSSVELAVEKLEGLFQAREAEAEVIIMQAKTALDKHAKNGGLAIVDLIQQLGKCDRASWASVIADVEQEASALRQEAAATDDMLAKLASALANINDGLQKL
ncbi:unnamed protein product [Ixodes hexagonus]